MRGIMTRRVLTLVVAFVLLLTLHARAQAPHRLKVLLDTDIASDIDDAWALGLLVASPDVELMGVTITDGNTPGRAKVACKLLHVVGRDDVPVAAGRQTAPPNEYDYQFGWAEDFTAKQPIATPAADFIVDTLRKHPGEITLVAVGPLQNVADALRKEPRLGQLASRIVLMSGSIGPNAWTPAPIAEWNVVRSTADAQLVYGAGLNLTTVPLDSTTYMRLKSEERARLEAAGTPLTRALESLYRLWLKDETSRMTLHDQLAIAETLRPHVFFNRCESMPILVDDKGFTRVDRDRGKATTVCFEPKRDEFMKFYLDGLLALK